MSMPIIKSSNISRCQAITDIIESIALEQTGLAHIINAEGEKIQKSLDLCKTEEELIKINSSVQSMIEAITILETILHKKLELFNKCLCDTYNLKPHLSSAIEAILEDDKTKL